MVPARTCVILSLVSVLLGACGGDDTATEAPAASAVVTIERSGFEPEALEVTTGSEVTFENLDPYAHTVTSAEGSALEFESGQLGQDETFAQTFEEVGTYEYFCEIHPTMRAEVVVG